VKAEKYITALSSPETFRHRLATIKEYKGNRDKTHKPVHFAAIKEYIVNHHNPVIIPDLEADDILGIMQDKDTVICSIDKDLDMIPGDHYNFVTGERYWVTDDDAIYCYYKQLLTGDATDNIRGIPGVGDVAAARILDGLQGPEAMEEAVRRAYEDAGILQELEETKKLVWILREPL
jgi:5'-3' exonuclease